MNNNSDGIWIIWLIMWTVFAIAGWKIGETKGRAGAGAALGLLAGIFGIIVIACLPKTAQKRAEEAQAQHGYVYARAAYGTSMGVQTPVAPPAGWFPDPHRRHEYRYWDGFRWTENVADDGRQSVEALSPPIA